MNQHGQLQNSVICEMASHNYQDWHHSISRISENLPTIIRADDFHQKSWDEIEMNLARLLCELLYWSGRDAEHRFQAPSELFPEDILQLCGAISGTSLCIAEPFEMCDVRDVRRVLFQSSIFNHGPGKRSLEELSVSKIQQWSDRLEYLLSVSLPKQTWSPVDR